MYLSLVIYQIKQSVRAHTNDGMHCFNINKNNMGGGVNNLQSKSALCINYCNYSSYVYGINKKMSMFNNHNQKCLNQ